MTFLPIRCVKVSLISILGREIYYHCCSQQRPDRPASLCSGSYCKARFYNGERGERGMKGGDGGNAGKPGKK